MKKIGIGDKASLVNAISERDITLFAQASGDMNPLHLDEEYAKSSIFGKRIAHGMLSASFISAVLGTILPGEGSIYISQSLNFKAPVFINDVITTNVEVIEVKGNRVVLKTICVNQYNKIVIDGEAKLLLPGE